MMMKRASKKSLLFTLAGAYALAFTITSGVGIHTSDKVFVLPAAIFLVLSLALLEWARMA